MGMTSRHRFAFSQHAFLLEACSTLSPSKQRARGGRAPDAPCRRVCNGVVVDAHALAGHTGITRHSPRNGLRIMACSPWCTGFLATIARGGLAANLTPASRSRYHTHFPSASGALVESTLRVHRSPPRVVDVGQRPS